MSELSKAITLRTAEAGDRELTASIDYAKKLSASDLLPKSYQGKPQNVLLAIEHGRSIGVAPITAINMVHIISGKPTASAQLVGALVRRAGHRLRVTGDQTKARAVIIRADDPDFEFVSEWTYERAQAAKITNNPTWNTFRAAMLKARAITEVARDACPEVLAGIAYTAEELGVTDIPPVLPATDTAGDVTEGVVDAELVEDALFDGDPS